MQVAWVGGCNSTFSLVTRFGALVMKNRVVGSQTRAILRAGTLHRAICRAESQCREPVQGLGVSILLPV